MLYKEATVPTFLEVLHLSIKHNVSVMFDLRLPPKSHPYHNTTYTSIVDIITMSGIDETNVSFCSYHCITYHIYHGLILVYNLTSLSQYFNCPSDNDIVHCILFASLLTSTLNFEAISIEQCVTDFVIFTKKLNMC